MVESFWSTMQRELLDQRIWQTPEELGAAIFEWIEAWYNPRRGHTSIGMLSPVYYEHAWQQSRTTAGASHRRQRSGSITTPPVMFPRFSGLADEELWTR